MKNKKVVFVDDNPTDLLLYGAMTKRMDYDVLMISDSRVAIENIIKFEPDVVFLDFRLNNNITGLDLLNQLQALNVKCKIVMLTSSDESRVIQQSLDDGADDYIVKPIYSNSLNNIIESSNGNTKGYSKQMLNYC